MTLSLLKTSIHLFSIYILISLRYEARASPLPSSIIDGPFADENEFKYIVAIRQEGFGFHGAGSILHPEWIITARHVVVKKYDDPKSSYFNMSKRGPLGVYPKYHNNLSYYYERVAYPVKHLYCHPFSDDINVYGTDNDIALVQLIYPLPLEANSNYKFEKIDWNTRDIDFQFGKIDLMGVGWGLTSSPKKEGNIRNLQLRKAYYKSFQVSMWADHQFRPFQQFKMSNPKHEICRGDSGGPVVIRDSRTGKDLLVGVISNGPSNCKGPSTHQNIAFYKEWIEEVVKKGDPVENLRKYSCDNIYGEYNNL